MSRLSTTPLSDSWEPIDKTGWRRVVVRGTNMVTGREVVEETWVPNDLSPHVILEPTESIEPLAVSVYPVEPSAPPAKEILSTWFKMEDGDR